MSDKQLSIIERLSAPLSADDVELRIGSTSDKGFSLLCYKTARTDVKRLNDVCGTAWSNEYSYDQKGLLCCSISIFDDILNQWVTRTDVGTESNTEKEKGSYSDAFKRAGFKWGIGAELYNSPFIWVQWEMKVNEYRSNGNKKVYEPVGFYPNKLEIPAYEVFDGHFNALTITHNGKVIFKYGEAGTKWPVYNDATPKVQRQALSEFKNICGSLDVDPIEFLRNQGSEIENDADKYKAVRPWLNGNIDQLHDQLLTYKSL